jgi:hypothetical protein
VQSTDDGTAYRRRRAIPIPASSHRDVELCTSVSLLPPTMSLRAAGWIER